MGESDAVARMVAAARVCFARDGARKTRMAAIAREAGMVRQTVYDFVSSRRELLELALAQRLLELSDVISSRVRAMRGSASGALVEYLAVVIETVREDPEFLDISDALGPADAIRFLTGPSIAQLAATRSIEPFFERARGENALRPGITLDDMAEWMRVVCTPLTMRAELEARELRVWLTKFALPPLLNEQHLRDAPRRRTRLRAVPSK